MATATYYGTVTYSDGQAHNWYGAKLVLHDVAITGTNSSRVYWDYYVWMKSASLTPYKYKYGNKLTLSMNNTTLIDTANYGTHDVTGHVGEENALKYASGSTVIQHDANGTKTFIVSLVYEQTQTSTLDRVNVIGTYTCSPIARTSALTVSGGLLGSAQTIGITRQSSAYRDTVTYSVNNGAYTGTLAELTAEESLSWTPPLTYASNDTTKAECSCTYTVTTYNGSAVVGTASATVTLALPASVVPVLPEGTVSAAPAQSYAALTGYSGYVAGKSGVKVSIGSVPGDAYGATIASVSIKLGSTENTYATLPCESTITGLAEGQNTITYTVTNSRGRSTSGTLAVAAVKYISPYISGIAAQRCNAAGTLLTNGTYAKLSGALGGSAYGANGFHVSVAVAGQTETGSVLPMIVGAGAISPAATYQLTATVTDDLDGTTVYVLNIPDESIPFHIKANGKAVGIGAYAEDDDTLNIGYAKVLLNGVEVNLGGDKTKLELDDNAGNTLSMQADGSTVIDTTKTHPAEAGATLGVKMALANLATDGIMGRERGITFSMQRRLSGADQTYIGYLLTTGMLEIRYGTTGQLNTSASGVKTTFSPAMSNAPQIVLLTPKTGVAGVAAPKVVSMDKTGFNATLGGSTGANTTCYYLAIRFNYWPN